MCYCDALAVGIAGKWSADVLVPVFAVNLSSGVGKRAAVGKQPLAPAAEPLPAAFAAAPSLPAAFAAAASLPAAPSLPAAFAAAASLPAAP